MLGAHLARRPLEVHNTIAVDGFEITLAVTSDEFSLDRPRRHAKSKHNDGTAQKEVR